ncbi:NADPH-dependent F420 reductase [Halalkaliarchaeum desulfuricum]|uniref:NADPH-dependent F420 reductase n=1 Tax=Halalkaliarchaeum desulfuricum TaxID=2055893 RepID=A0A343TM04_9EURY|nr:NADPH-dependent F420 reductase [Halalkaliarchaeum desulfuricum]AUX10126.1 NADPH-dependent F420 reductase [Halalkaliarchaeum desulfuricum]
MRIALLGGTGDIGEGLALRWAHDTDHTIVIGSRNEEKAQQRAEDYRETLDERDKSYDIEGTRNAAATEGADVVVVSVPPEYATDTVGAVTDALDDDAVLVSPAVRMNRDGAGFHYDQPELGSVAEEIAAVAPEQIPVVGAFQNVAAGALTNLDGDLSADIVVTGDDDEAKQTVTHLAEEIVGIRALDGGPLATSALVESVTPLLINLAMNNDGMHDLGVRFQ